MELKELKVYILAMEAGERIWKIVDKWDYFPKSTLGKQWVRSADSIAANISEGYGRYHFKENRNFNYIARGSLFETATWLQKAKSRNLINEEEYRQLKTGLEILGVKLNNYINTIGKKPNLN